MQFLRLLSFLALVSFCYAKIIQVTDENFSSLVNDSDEWILDFYAPWCHHCKSFESSYKLLDNSLLSNGMNVKLGKVDTDSNPYLAARFFVSRLPTVVHIKNRQVRFISQRNPSALLQLLEEETWKEIEPKTGVMSPYGFMGISFGYIGAIVKKVSTMSPWTLVGGLVVLLILAIGLPAYLGPAGGDQSKRETKTSASSTSVTARPDAIRQRRSKRID
ncbi:thioredoxin-like protein [Phycomyces blakesleeanus]|uniref:Thioredoxin domain-containing protein n=2 Tax=Phycomyces blakesleeanus TaxID=4837 RepID=A0A162U816_PHYB8|nr:hypothetical protein PHYBLDRAFT_77516 [Phycomyces blakesleeanus NRRL 1555(-)]OAD74202.1 hypothetical protein PHYBLDRAFT_77516 [Phycomyces blakesleeanus NRRL 1555(-)]|eukprot:XP_018292242.1 hypothetical protein PHYBLDRAFT_77516 [Phycomyces blakesleeanus NRRL 1555(-)]